MSLFILALAVLSYGIAFVSAAPLLTGQEDWSRGTTCYPALGFQKPIVMPHSNTNWWCDPSTEYAFVGFSYEVTDCMVASCYCGRIYADEALQVKVLHS